MVAELAPLDEGAMAGLIGRYVAEPDQELVEQIAAISGGVPFAVAELARRAASEPAWVQMLDATMVGGIDPLTREVLQRVAVVGATFDTDQFVALSGLPDAEAFAHLDHALAARIVEHTTSAYQFRHGLVRDALLEDLAPHRQRRIHRDAADRLAELGAPPARIGYHLLRRGRAGRGRALPAEGRRGSRGDGRLPGRPRPGRPGAGPRLGRRPRRRCSPCGPTC